MTNGGTRVLYPDLYKARHIDKSLFHEPTDNMIVGTIVDKYFDDMWDSIWNEYEAVSRRTWKSDKIEITKTMEDRVNTMIRVWVIVWLDVFKEQCETQKQLYSEVEIYDKKIKIKALPDFINNKTKEIIDLKTTASINQIVEDLQFRWKPKLTARYIRQWAICRKILWDDYTFRLAILSDEKWWVYKSIVIPNEILDASWNILEKDIYELQSYLDSGEIQDSIFDLSKLDNDDDVEEL